MQISVVALAPLRVRALRLLAVAALAAAMIFAASWAPGADAASLQPARHHKHARKHKRKHHRRCPHGQNANGSCEVGVSPFA
ncbi:MAG: hypothetical protein NVSMB25_19420 [Thermoleophilaceae bacterium]